MNTAGRSHLYAKHAEAVDESAAARRDRAIAECNQLRQENAELRQKHGHPEIARFLQHVIDTYEICDDDVAGAQGWIKKLRGAP